MGTIFVELVLRKPFLPGETDVDQLKRIIAVLGTPTDEDWPVSHEGSPHASRLMTKNVTFQGHRSLPDYFPQPESVGQRWTPWVASVGKSGIDLILKTLRYDPTKRITAKDVGIRSALIALTLRKEPLHGPERTILADMNPSSACAKLGTTPYILQRRTPTNTASDPAQAFGRAAAEGLGSGGAERKTDREAGHGPDEEEKGRVTGRWAGKGR